MGDSSESARAQSRFIYFSRQRPPLRPRTSTLNSLALVVLGLWITLGLVRIIHEAHYSIFERYIASQWFVTYQWGFVRRGLPGQVLSLAGENRYRVLEFTAWAIPLLGIFVMLWVIVQLSQSFPSKLRLVLTVILISSPLSVSMFIHDIGRLDGLIVSLLALNILLARLKQDWVWFLATIGVGLLSILISEFAFLFLIPIVIVSMSVRDTRSVWYGAASLVVFTSFGLYSLGQPLSSEGLSSILSDAGRELSPDGAAYWLSESAPDLTQLSLSLGPWLALSLAIYCCLFVVPIAALALSLKLQRSRWLSTVVLCLLAVAIVGSIAAYDARRYFGIAFMTLLIATSIYLAPHGSRMILQDRPESQPFILVAITCLLSSLFTQSLPITHVTPGDLIQLVSLLA